MKNFNEIYIKYNQAGPKYQYYPTILGFQETIKHKDIVEKMIGLNGKDINLKLFWENKGLNAISRYKKSTVLIDL